MTGTGELPPRIAAPGGALGDSLRRGPTARIGSAAIAADGPAAIAASTCVAPPRPPAPAAG